MSEKILEITEVLKDDMDGYIIKTTKQEIEFLISNGQSCCENWGYLLSQDDTSDFIGADLLNIILVDEFLGTKEFAYSYLEEGSVIFVNIETSKGTLQFTAYNSHNGYYGHKVKIISNQLNEETYI